MHKNVTIAITPGTIVMAIAIGAAAYALWLLRDIALLVLTAIVIASAIEPGVAFFIRQRMHRILAVAIVYSTVFGILFLLTYFFLPPIIREAQSFIFSLPSYLTALGITPALAGVPALEAGTGARSIIDTLLAYQSAFTDASGSVFRFLSTFFGGVFSFLLVIVLSFYFAVQSTGVEDFIRLLAPSKHEQYAVGLWGRAQRKIGLWMQGQLLLSFISGTITYVGLLLLGVPYALLLAVLTAILNLVPIFGSLIAGGLATIIAFASGGLTLAIGTAVLFLAINQFEGNVLYPIVVNKIVGIPPLLVILALLVGGSLAGFLGVVLSIPLAAAFREFLGDFERSKRLRAAAAVPPSAA